jgi:hypothetical protein
MDCNSVSIFFRLTSTSPGFGCICSVQTTNGTLIDAPAIFLKKHLTQRFPNVFFLYQKVKRNGFQFIPLMINVVDSAPLPRIGFF